MAYKPNYQPKNLNKFLTPLINLEAIWLKLNSLLDKEQQAILKEDFDLLEKLISLENNLIKEIFDLSNLIQTLRKDLIKEGYSIISLFNLWHNKEKTNKKNYLIKKENIINNIKNKKEKVLEKAQDLKESPSQKIRRYHQNFPLPKILDIHT